MNSGPFEPDSPVIVDGIVTKQKLRTLLGHQAEYSNLDYKSDFEVKSKRGMAEFAKDVGAFQPRGGYIIAGANKKGVLTGDLDGVDQDIFDPSNLMPKLHRFLPKTIKVSSQFHTLDGHDVLLICVHRSLLGYAIFHMDGQYTENGKPECAFRAGEIYWRNGPTSERITPQGLERIIEWRIATGIAAEDERKREPLPKVVDRYRRAMRQKGWKTVTVDDYSYNLRRLVEAHEGLTLAYFEPPLGTDRLSSFIDAEWGSRTVGDDDAHLHAAENRDVT